MLTTFLGTFTFAFRTLVARVCVDELFVLITFIICPPIFLMAPLLEVNRTICIMTDGILISIKEKTNRNGD